MFPSGSVNLRTMEHVLVFVWLSDVQTTTDWIRLDLIIDPTSMAPKGGNAKKESGRAKKAENEANKKAQVAAEKVCPISLLLAN